MGRYFIRASSLIGLRELAERQGADLAAAMQSVGLRMDLLRKPDERISFETVCALFEHCAQVWNLPDFGLRLANYHHLNILGVVGLATKMEGTLRGAVNTIIANLVIHSDAKIAALDERDGVATVTLETHPTTAYTRQYMLASLGTARSVIEQAGNAGLKLIEVSLRHEAGGVQAAAEAFFGCPVRFNAERNALYFDAAVLDRPTQRSDTAYHAIIDRYLTTLHHELGGGVAETVRKEIARQMEFGRCTLESVAQRLRIEPRSLQRQLKQDGSGFRDLMDDWRRERALSLVTRTRLPLMEVTLALGYSDQSIFSRAFQRWYGQSPLAYRLKDAAMVAALRHGRARPEMAHGLR
ncbi:AraC family transcriptional regulator [Paracoccus litorisediminis]|nr:AraC family transcriptional regulator [Paracoccus litorisediminis]